MNDCQLKHHNYNYFAETKKSSLGKEIIFMSAKANSEKSLCTSFSDLKNTQIRKKQKIGLKQSASEYTSHS